MQRTTCSAEPSADCPHSCQEPWNNWDELAPEVASGPYPSLPCVQIQLTTPAVLFLCLFFFSGNAKPQVSNRIINLVIAVALQEKKGEQEEEEEEEKEEGKPWFVCLWKARPKWLLATVGVDSVYMYIKSLLVTADNLKMHFREEIMHWPLLFCIRNTSWMEEMLLFLPLLWTYRLPLFVCFCVCLLN